MRVTIWLKKIPEHDFREKPDGQDFLNPSIISYAMTGVSNLHDLRVGHDLFC
jgi:hypothetical protein